MRRGGGGRGSGSGHIWAGPGPGFTLEKWAYGLLNKTAKLPPR
jgi:hypothetical protein